MVPERKMNEDFDEKVGSCDCCCDFFHRKPLCRGKNSNPEHPPSPAEVWMKVSLQITVLYGSSLDNMFPRVSELSLCALSVSLHANNHKRSNEYEKQL